MPTPPIVIAEQARRHQAVCTCGTLLRSATYMSLRMLIDHHTAGRNGHYVTEVAA